MSAASLGTAVAAPGQSTPAVALGRIAMLGPAPPALGGRTPGGVATHTVHLVRALGAAGADVRLLATNAPAASPVEPPGRTDGLTLARLYAPGRLTDWLAPAYLAAVGPTTLARYAARLARYSGPPLGSRQVALAQVLWYRRFLAETRPTLLHVQHPLDRLLYARLVCQAEGWRLPLVVTAHSFFDEHPDETIERLMRPNLTHADRVIAVSPHIADQAVSLGVDRARVRVVRSGVDAERFRPRDRLEARRHLGVAPDEPLVLFVGNLEPRKAIDKLLLAVDRVRQVVPDVCLAIVGTGESAGAENQGPRLRQMVAELGLGERVRFVGRVSEEALLDWYAAADVFALPSSSEAQGIVALEAMASGLPVVVSAVGGLLGTVEDGENGYLVPFGDVAVLADRLARLLPDAALQQAMGTAAREAVIREFSWQRVAEQTIEVYREALGEWQVSGGSGRASP